MLSPNEMKQLAAQEAAQLIAPGMTLGLGTGSTARFLITALAARVRNGLSITAVPTSSETEKLARENGIDVKSLDEVEKIDLTIDGTDEIDPQYQLIKGGGGALLQEKIVASFSEKLVIIADHTKLVPALGKFPLPVEVIPYGWKHVQHYLQHTYRIEAHLRMKNGQPWRTDHGHYLLDCHFEQIPDAAELNRQLNAVPGIVETGLFINMTHAVYIAYPDGKVDERPLGK